MGGGGSVTAGAFVALATVGVAGRGGNAGTIGAGFVEGEVDKVRVGRAGIVGGAGGAGCARSQPPAHSRLIKERMVFTLGSG